MDVKSELCLPISPYLDNCVEWWIENYIPDYHRHSLRPITQDEREQYRKFMVDQGVIDPARINKLVLVDEPGIYFESEEDMIIFALRWGD